MKTFSRLKITNVYLLFKIINNYFFSTETSICSRNIFKYANIYLQWIKPFHRLNRRTQFKISSALKNLRFLKSHCLLSYKEKAISKGKSAKKICKEMHVGKWKNVQTFVQHRHSNHTHGTLKSKMAIFTAAFPNTIIPVEKRSWLLHCKCIASWSKFSTSVGLKIKFSSCWQGRCVCITAEPLYLPAGAVTAHAVPLG